MRAIFFIVFIVGFVSQTLAQHHPQAHCDSLRNDTSVHTVSEIFSHGTFHGHARHYFMSTINPGNLNDYWANALGGALGYNSARVHGFSIGIKGQFSYNVWSNELTENNEEIGRHSRYELQLFDVDHPHNYNDLDRLEEFFVDYLTDFGYYKIGKMDITTPLVNPQDGRMKPYVLHGVFSKTRIANNLIFNLGLFNKFSPRSTTHWYSAEESIGIYGQGTAINGLPSEYRDHIETKGLFLTGLQFHSDQIRFQAWNYYIENISNTLFGQFNFHSKEANPQWRFGLQFLTQSQVGVGGNNDSLHFQYHTENDKAKILSGRIARKANGVTFSLNALHAFGDGRFIFPREWGREQFFVTISRGRVEGTGKMSVVMLKSRIEPKTNEHFHLDLAGGYFFMPSIHDYTLSKYAMPSHYQFNADLKYSFGHILEGMDVRLLYIWKTPQNINALENASLFNKSNYHQINLVTNIHF
ncbi:MAG: OprD family outer membrane porin [Bacteroidia bacterium]